MHDIKTELLSIKGTRVPVRLSIIPLSERREEKELLLLFRDLRTEERLFRKTAKSVSFGRIISCDPKMNEIFELIEKVAASSAIIHIKGESGTGKELAAREIHDRSRQASGPFHPVNCAAISPNLMESEFFGHERGAFTGADRTKVGRFELAKGGTLFLDEVADIPLDLQGKLLRVLQEQEFERVGGTKVIRTDVRVIAASNRDLLKMVEEKTFRDDLYYRLHVIPVYLPPLRERLQDIPILVSHFIEVLNKKEHRQIQYMASEAIHQLLQYSWPGNVRELQNAVEYAYAVCEGHILRAANLPETIYNAAETPGLTSELPNNDRELVLQALQKSNFSKFKAASLLGIHRTTLYRKIKKYNL